MKQVAIFLSLLISATSFVLENRIPNKTEEDCDGCQEFMEQIIFEDYGLFSSPCKIPDTMELIKAAFGVRERLIFSDCNRIVQFNEFDKFGSITIDGQFYVTDSIIAFGYDALLPEEIIGISDTFHQVIDSANYARKIGTWRFY